MRSMLRLCAFLLMLPMLGGCFLFVAGATAGAGAAHDRRGFTTVVADRNLQLSAYDAINKDKELALKNNVSIVVYDGVMLLIGQVRTPELKARAQRIATGFEGIRRVVNEIDIETPDGFWRRRADSAITTRVKTGLLDIRSMPGFDMSRVNVTTDHAQVYLMGKVSHEEADAVVAIARDVGSVEKVVKVFEYTD